MKLQTKAVLGVNLFIVIACLCMGVLGYRSAADGFAKSLQMKADSNVKSLITIRGKKNVRLKHSGGDEFEIVIR